MTVNTQRTVDRLEEEEEDKKQQQKKKL